MIDKFNITKREIDISKINRQIDKFRLFVQQDPYIFMNSDTIDELIKIIGYNADGLHGVIPSGLCGTYYGYKLFCDQTKKYGDVELR